MPKIRLISLFILAHYIEARRRLHFYQNSVVSTRITIDLFYTERKTKVKHEVIPISRLINCSSIDIRVNA